MEVSLPGCKGSVDAASFDGYNLGCFANQGGLQQGLKQLALDLNVGACNFRDTENAARAVCQLKFSNGNRLNTKQHVCLKTSRRLQCHRGQAQNCSLITVSKIIGSSFYPTVTLNPIPITISPSCFDGSVQKI